MRKGIVYARFQSRDRDQLPSNAFQGLSICDMTCRYSPAHMVTNKIEFYVFERHPI